MMRVVNVDEAILRELDIDTRAVFMGAAETNKQEIREDGYTDIWGVERIKHESWYYFDQEKFPLAGDISVTDIVNYPWPDPDDPGFIRGLAERVGWIRKNTDCAAILSLPAPFIHITQYLRGYEDWFCDFALNPAVLEALFDAVLEITLEVAKHELQAVGDEVDIVICADDLGTQTGLQMSREMYLKYVKPRHEKYFRQIHELSPAKLLFHSCGSVAAIIDDLIGIGVDILNPVQTTATGMEPEILKRKYKGKLAFWGAMDTQKILPLGTVDDVEKMVEDMVEKLGEGGGYVLSSCHNLQPDVPVENILAMFNHAREYTPSYLK